MAPASLCRFVPVQTGSRVAAEVWSSGIQLCYRTHDFTHLIKRFSISGSDVLRVENHHRPTSKGLRSVSDETLHDCSVTSFNKPVRSENINALRRTYPAEMTLKSHLHLHLQEQMTVVLCDNYNMIYSLKNNNNFPVMLQPLFRLQCVVSFKTIECKNLLSYVLKIPMKKRLM